MNGVISWFLERTKVGRAVKSVQEYLDGKKAVFAALGTAIPATLLIVHNFTEQGTPYLLSIAHTPEFQTAGIGWTGLFLAIKGQKTRNEIADLHDAVVENQVISSQAPTQNKQIQ